MRSNALLISLGTSATQSNEYLVKLINKPIKTANVSSPQLSITYLLRRVLSVKERIRGL